MEQYTAMNLATILAGSNYPLSAYKGKVTIYADFLGTIFSRIPEDLKEWNFDLKERAFVFGENERIYVAPLAEFLMGDFD